MGFLGPWNEPVTIVTGPPFLFEDAYLFSFFLGEGLLGGVNLGLPFDDDTLDFAPPAIEDLITAAS